MISSPDFAGKTYHVLGLARTGMSVVASLLEGGAEVAAWDDREEARAQLPERVAQVDPMQADLRAYDALIVSPGVPLNTHPLAERARGAATPIIGDIELFSKCRPHLPPHRVVGVTGTNGKSTTVSLIHHVLQTAEIPSTLGGNIGAPILGQQPVSAGGVYVLELSSYQIDLTRTLDCDVAVLLNITPDHLDRYDGFEAYAASKARLLGMQSEAHKAVVGGHDAASRAIATAHSGHLAPVIDDLLDRQDDWPALAGPHNRENAATAIAVLRELGLGDALILAGLRSFTGLAHRMEPIGEARGVRFVNDSKATNAESAAPALAAFENVHWILGGRAKSADLSTCAPYFGHVKAAYLIGEAAEKFAGALDGQLSPVHQCGDLERATRAAYDAAKEGDVILLAPACASFDQYRDFEERGEHFRTLANALIEESAA